MSTKNNVGVFTVDFGFTSAALSGTLAEVLSFADEECGFTQRDVVVKKVNIDVDKFNETAENGSPWALITQNNQEEVARRVWCSGETFYDGADAYTEEQLSEVIPFGKCGVYAPWELY